jgi:DNA-binding response OmpR family regulator
MANTVLIVDDNRKICEVLENFLRGEDFEVLCADTGAGALDILASARVDIAVIDLLLPGDVSGQRVIERATDAGIPVITMSGALASDSRGRDLMPPHLRKPFKMRELRYTIDTVLVDRRP